MNTAPSRLVRRVRSWPRRVVLTVAVIALVLVAARIALPFIVQHQVNKRLAAIPGHWGQVEGIGLALWRGAYKLDGLTIFKVDGGVREPFVAIRHIDFSVAWREVWHRRFVSQIHLDKPELYFVATGVPKQKDADLSWQEVIQDLFPIEITHLEITNGLVRYQDLTKTPHVDLFIKNMGVVATGLRNRSDDEGGEEFPAKIDLVGESLGGGKLKLFIEAEPLASQPHFHLSAKLDGVNLPDLNDSLRAYANVDVGRGTFRMAAEMAGKDGGFQGYVKPFFEDLDFNNLEDKKRGVFSRIWESVVQGLAWMVKNKARDQVGTRIPFEGRFGDPKLGLGAAIMNLFRHGFIRAFNPTVEGSVHADNVLPSGASADGKKVGATKVDPQQSVENAKLDTRVVKGASPPSEPAPAAKPKK